MAVIVSDTTPLNYLVLIEAVEVLPRYTAEYSSRLPFKRNSTSQTRRSRYEPGWHDRLAG